MSRIPNPPAHLTRRSKALWRRVLADYLLEPAQAEILRRACEQSDRADAARLVVEEEGVTTTDRFGQIKEHPAVAVERLAHLAVARLLRELNLQPAPADSRPPDLGYGGD